MRSDQLLKKKEKKREINKGNKGTHEIEDGPHVYIVIGVMVLSLGL